VRESGRGSAAAVLGAFSIIVPIPAGSSGLELENYPVGAVEDDLAVRAARLEAYVGTSRLRRLLVWRLYRGIGSSAVDGVTELRDGGMHVQFRTVEHGAYLVGRVALSAGRVRTRNDPFRRLRMAMAEREEGGLQIVREFPRIEHARSDPLPMVVAVHGTMSTAIPMAGALASLVPRHRIVRFEHDTWHSIVQNSDLLAQQIWRLGPERISLVAHSRGGLVARRASEVLAERGRADVRVITLGTPFAGTELVDQARGGLLGARVALGAMRVLTGGMIDPISRLASLLFHKLPPGIEEMSPDSLFRTAYAGGRANLPLFAVAGDVDAEGAAEVSGLSLSALHGLARAGYGRNGASGDLVVSVRSATTGVIPDNTRVVASDHFSYFLQDEVRQLIRVFA
jgi:pimeloyl-ACP methyl ester carboxylesterase